MEKLPDSIVSPHPDPVGDGPVLLLLLGKLLLNKECLVRRLNGVKYRIKQKKKPSDQTGVKLRKNLMSTRIEP